MKNQTIELSVFRLALVDLLAILAIYSLPTISHFFPFPMYFSEPMRIIAIAVYFLSKNRKNSFLLALTLPLFSMMFSGHPIPIKAGLISMELLINIFLLDVFFKRFKWNAFIALSSSILLSKVLYYFSKYIFIKLTFLEGALVSIPIYIQILSLMITSLVFFIFLQQKTEKK